MRETLFNWLRQDLEGFSCLDLYAGSGALGFEAASRGAARVVLVERDTQASLALRKNCAVLDAQAVEVAQAEVARFLAGAAKPYDIVFLDPPFRQGLAVACCRLLEERGWLAPDARVYIETERDLELEDLPSNWQILREKKAGQVACRLFQRNP